MEIEIIIADITTLNVDAIVNAANSSLMGGGGVDGAIHKAAGIELRKYCSTLGGCKTGEAVITPAFNLTCKNIIHTVGPVWNNGTDNEENHLENCYNNCLKIASDNHLESIAFPCISTGAFRFPFDKAASIAYNTISRFLESNTTIKKVYLVVFSQKDFDQYYRAISKLEKDMIKLTKLYRPIGQKEYDLIEHSRFKKFPPRLDWQPIFYPVLNQTYAEQIAFEWNTEDEFSGYIGYVTAFDLKEDYLSKYPIQNVGGIIHNELWIPANELEEFNNNIIGNIRVVKTFFGKKHHNMLNQIRGVLIGLATGDALGVPVEFKTREYLIQNPITTLTGYGSWQQPAGTWSDDGSLAFCLAESLTKGYQLDDIANNFTLWLQQGFWGAHYEVFDVGGATRQAIKRLIKGCSPILSGGMEEKDNGNGSLMRIMPLLFYTKQFEIDKRYELVKEVSAITHAHFRSVFSCFIILEFALNIFNGATSIEAYKKMQIDVKSFANKNSFNDNEIILFARILDNDISQVDVDFIKSSGYVIDTLEATLWCLLNTISYSEAVLKAVNLGGDTDTTACITGGLAGLIYGAESIPSEWIKGLARISDIENLSLRLNKAISI